MALVHQQREQAEARLQENHEDIAMSRTQMQELVHSVQQLSEKFNANKKRESARDRGKRAL